MLINLDDFSRMLKIERNYSENTISAYLSDLKSFNVFLVNNKTAENVNIKELLPIVSSKNKTFIIKNKVNEEFEEKFWNSKNYCES